VIVGSPAYPQTQYRAALLTVAVSSIVGLTTQALVADVRRQAKEASMRERMLEQVSEVVRDLFSSSQARLDVCEAVMRISQATVALMYEPLGNTGALYASAIAGFDAEPTEISAPSTSAVQEVFASGRAVLVTENVQARVGSKELWEAAGCPQSVLYEPLLQWSEPIGVLVVGWPGAIRAEGTRATVAALLAHEAAALIDRADTLDALTGMAQSDPLTGLPNRRTWDAHLGQALAGETQLTVAMLDFDYFKQFNDTHGHAAGDRLLKETAALWRDQLRSGDLLARLGGEEFGLLLLNCDPERAQDVIDRLRGAVSHGRTCSAGFALRRPGEAADTLMARADAALYEAKAAGRDCACMSA
jgi:diguanylate cyclase (GGDEF)-like protein